MTKKTTTRLFLAFISLILLLSLVKCSNDFIGVGTRDGAKAVPAKWIHGDTVQGYYAPGLRNTTTIHAIGYGCTMYPDTVITDGNRIYIIFN